MRYSRILHAERNVDAAQASSWLPIQRERTFARTQGFGPRS